MKEKKERLRDEPSEEGSVLVIFRLPLGNERIQRRFLKTDKIQKLYDFVDVYCFSDSKALGFEQSDSDIKYELVTAPTPQIKKLNDLNRTLEDEGILRSTLLNIKQIY
jgi:UBX domain